MIYLSFVDIRIFDDEKILNDALNNASKFRLDKYNSYNHKITKLQSIAGTYLINKALNKFGRIEKNMEYIISKNGKPYFKNETNIFFNISHSENIAMIVMSDKEIGCDIQIIKKIPYEIIDKVLAEDEKIILYNIQDEKSREEIFYTYWSNKEAILKLNGEGLCDDIKNVNSKNVYHFIKNFDNNYSISIYNNDNINSNMINII